MSNNKSVLDGLSAEQLGLYRLILLSDFEEFAKFAFSIRTGKKLTVQPHHKVMCQTIDKVIAGEITKLITTIPPRCSKSEFYITCLSARAFAGRGDANNLQVSFSQDNVEQHSRYIQEIVSHEDFQRLFYVGLATENVSRWETTLGGHMHSKSTGGKITGLEAGVSDPSEGTIDETDIDKLFNKALGIKDSNTENVPRGSIGIKQSPEVCFSFGGYLGIDDPIDNKMLSRLV